MCKLKNQSYSGHLNTTNIRTVLFQLRGNSNLLVKNEVRYVSLR